MSDQQAESGTGPDPQDVREEAERLVATGLAALSMVAERIGAPSRERGGSMAVGYDALGDVLFGSAGHRRHSVANESPECCRCPVCRAISAAREPNPQMTERLATGVGTVAEGAARVLRGLAGAAGAVRENWQPRSESKPDLTDPWATATAEPAAPASAPTTAPAPVEPPFGPPAGGSGDGPPTGTATGRPAGANQPTAKKVTKKTVKKAAKKAPPGAGQAVESNPAAAKAAKKAAAKRTVAKKAVAKKSAAKKNGAAPPPGLAGEADR